MAAVSGLFVVVLLFALLAPIGLWLLIREETAETQVRDREAAERAVRNDTGADDDRTGNHWGDQ